MSKLFKTREVVAFGWDKTNDHLKFFIPFTAGLIVLVIVLNMVMGRFATAGGFLSLSMNVVWTIIDVIITLGLIKLSLVVMRGGVPALKTVFSQTNHFFKYFFASLLYALIVFGGFLLLVVPGVIWAIRFRYFGYAIVDKNMGIMESLKESYRLTKGHTWNLFVFALALFGINLLGFIPLGLGLLVTIPLSMIAVARVWSILTEKSQSADVEVEPQELPEVQTQTETVAAV